MICWEWILVMEQLKLWRKKKKNFLFLVLQHVHHLSNLYSSIPHQWQSELTMTLENINTAYFSITTLEHITILCEATVYVAVTNRCYWLILSNAYPLWRAQKSPEVWNKRVCINYMSGYREKKKVHKIMFKMSTSDMINSCHHIHLLSCRNTHGNASSHNGDIHDMRKLG